MSTPRTQHPAFEVKALGVSAKIYGELNAEHAAKNAGRLAELAAGRRANVYLGTENIAIATALGSGKVSEGMCKALKFSANFPA